MQKFMVIALMFSFLAESLGMSHQTVAKMEVWFVFFSCLIWYSSLLGPLLLATEPGYTCSSVDFFFS